MTISRDRQMELFRLVIYQQAMEDTIRAIGAEVQDSDNLLEGRHDLTDEEREFINVLWKSP